jgi:uncharacterized protein (DUF1697 family)
MVKYVAFLRGINVGGHKAVKMEELKKAFAALGFDDVKTLLASGNVLFAAPPASEGALAKKIEKKLETAFGHEIGVLVRKVEGLQRLAEANPFAGVKVTPQTRLYVTFLTEKPKSGLKIPPESPDKNFKILRATESEVCSVLTLSPNSRTVDLMSMIEKEFGRKVTTRNWNTINKILKASASKAKTEK